MCGALTIKWKLSPLNKRLGGGTSGQPPFLGWTSSPLAGGLSQASHSQPEGPRGLSQGGRRPTPREGLRDMAVLGCGPPGATCL